MSEETYGPLEMAIGKVLHESICGCGKTKVARGDDLGLAAAIVREIKEALLNGDVSPLELGFLQTNAYGRVNYSGEVKDTYADYARTYYSDEDEHLRTNCVPLFGLPSGRT